MKKTFKLFCVVMAILVLLTCVVGCGSSGSSGTSNKQNITSSTEAINAVKNYMKSSSFSLNQRIASALGFKNFYDPDFGTSSATQNSDGSWDVTIKGSMDGYVDEYHDDFETYKFEVSATVSETGSVSISVKKVY